MRPIMFVTAAALTVAFTFPTQARADDSAERCKAFTEYEASLAKRLPMPSDSVTDVISMRINCNTTTQTWVKRIKVSGTTLAEGWRERKQRQHAQLHCNREGLASVAKWTVRDILFDKDNNLLAEFTTKPETCADQ